MSDNKITGANNTGVKQRNNNRRCCVASYCKSMGGDKTFDHTLSFHMFPLKNPDLLSKWVKAVYRKYFIPSNSSFLCSKHFIKENSINQNISQQTNYKELKTEILDK